MIRNSESIFPENNVKIDNRIKIHPKFKQKLP